MEASMKRTLQREKARLKRMRLKRDEEWYLCEQQTVEYEFREHFIPMLQYSSVVLIHAVFETLLHEFCSEIEKQRTLPVTLKDMHGKGLDRARLYLTKVARIKVADLSQWQELRKLQLVRECIAHAYGNIDELRDKGQQNQIKALEKDGVHIVHNRIRLSETFCHRQLSHLSDLMHALQVAAKQSN
jgi:hypothetical protein